MLAARASRVTAMPERNDQMVWIDCEMTGLDLEHDALVEVAALVTDSELNVLGDGVDVVIKPPQEALDTHAEVVRDMHTRPGCSTELESGMTLAEAEAQVLAYVREFVPGVRKAPLAGNTVYVDRGFLARDMPHAGRAPALPAGRRLLDQGAGPALVPAGLLQLPRQARRPPGPRRHPGEHRGAEVLPAGHLRAAARARTPTPSRRWPRSSCCRTLTSRDAGRRAVRVACMIPAPRMRGASWWV